MNALARDVGFKVGPVILEVLVKHYFERLKKDVEDNQDAGQKLKVEDVLYHEAFTIVKVSKMSSRHQEIPTIYLLSFSGVYEGLNYVCKTHEIFAPY